MNTYRVTINIKEGDNWHHRQIHTVKATDIYEACDFALIACEADFKQSVNCTYEVVGVKKVENNPA